MKKDKIEVNTNALILANAKMILKDEKSKKFLCFFSRFLI